MLRSDQENSPHISCSYRSTPSSLHGTPHPTPAQQLALLPSADSDAGLLSAATKRLRGDGGGGGEFEPSAAQRARTKQVPLDEDQGLRRQEQDGECSVRMLTFWSQQLCCRQQG